MLPSLCALSTDSILPCEHPNVDVLDVDEDTLVSQLHVKRTQGDGNCLFHALHALTREPTIPGTPFYEAPQFSTLGLRRRVYEYMQTHHATFAKMLDPTSIPKISPTESSENYVRRYVQKMAPVFADDGAMLVEMAGTIEIQVYAMLMNASIYVLSIEDPNPNPAGREKAHKRFAHVISRHFPCTDDGGTITAADARKLPVLVLLYHTIGAAPHYSSVHARAPKRPSPPPDENEMTASERSEYLSKRTRRVPLPKESMNWQLRRLRDERELRKRGMLCARDPGAETDPASAAAIRRLVEQDRQTMSDQQLAMALEKMQF